MECAICNKHQKHARALAQHVSGHKLTSHQYYDLYMKQSNEGICVVCQTPTKWKNMGSGYQRYCSRDCASKESSHKQWNGNEDRRKRLSEMMMGNKLSVGRPRGSKNHNKYPMSEAVQFRLMNNPPPSWSGKQHSEETLQRMSEAAIKRIERDGLPKTYKGKFRPQNPKKYRGDPTNIVFRSLWELRVMKKLDENPNVLEWSSEETIVPYYDPSSSRYRRYFPDFLVKTRQADGTTKTSMLEVKPKKETIEPKKKKRITKAYITEVTTWVTNQAKWKAATEYCLDRGWNFQIITEDDLGLNK